MHVGFRYLIYFCLSVVNTCQEITVSEQFVFIRMSIALCWKCPHRIFVHTHNPTECQTFIWAKELGPV